eukprot:gene7989-8847_t
MSVGSTDIEPDTTLPNTTPTGEPQHTVVEQHPNRTFLTIPNKTPNKKRRANITQLNYEEEIKNLAEEVFKERLENYDYDYDHDQCKQLCAEISKTIHDRIKVATSHRFKIIVLSFIGEVMDDGIEAASQCTWQPRNDIIFTVYFKSESLLALSNVFLTRIKETIV